VGSHRCGFVRKRNCVTIKNELLIIAPVNAVIRVAPLNALTVPDHDVLVHRFDVGHVRPVQIGDLRILPAKPIAAE